jgi:Tol biopolymer transport system component
MRRTFLVLALTLAGACRGAGAPSTETTVYTYASPLWYEETARYFQVSPTGALAIYGSGVRGRLIDLTAHVIDSTGWLASLGIVRAAAFDPHGGVFRLGATDSGGTLAWLPESGTTPLPVAAGALPRWSPDGSLLASFQPGDSVVTLFDRTASRSVRLDGAATGLTWTPTGHALFATALHDDGLTSLVRIDTAGTVALLRGGLDASPAFNALTVTPDGHTIYLALAGDPAPDVKVRHDPEALHRDLDIYTLSLPGGQLQRVAGTAGDDFAPVLSSGALYWTHNDPGAEVVVVPIAGGEPQAIADHGFLPRWSPDGRHVAFTRGYFRIADYGLDMDGWVVDVDSAGKAASAPRAWITGYGEDMGPVWSPDGRWVAYHSHRSATPVPLYGSPGRTDDQWLQLSAGGPEIRVTDFGFEVGPPVWSPDGRRLLFDSWEHEGVPRMAKPWITTIDPATGRTLGSKQIPLPAGVVGINGEAWSPNGEQIAFVQRIDETHQALWTMHPNGSGAKRLVEFPCFTIGGVAWTPDGRSLVYAAVAADHMELFSIGSSGGTPLQLTHGAVNVMHPHVSPDGRFVAASRVPWRKELRRLQLR